MRISLGIRLGVRAGRAAQEYLTVAEVADLLKISPRDW
jgi:hypothetical protein